MTHEFAAEKGQWQRVVTAMGRMLGELRTVVTPSLDHRDEELLRHDVSGIRSEIIAEADVSTSAEGGQTGGNR